MVYDRPARRTSASEAMKWRLPLVARRTICRRCSAGANSPSGLCGGDDAGTKYTRSSFSISRTSSAARRCPKWIGLKLPPKIPTRISIPSDPDLALAAHDVFVSRQFAQTHRPARVEAIGGNSGFGAEAEFESVGKARGRVDVNRSRIDLGFKARGGIQVVRDDGVGESRAVAADESDRFVDRIDHFHR